MIRHIKKLYNILLKLTYRIILALVSFVPLFKLYQPLYTKTTKASPAIRNSQDRWVAMEPHFKAINSGSVLDIGSNIGYFTFKTAELGHLSTGVESEDFNITVSNALRTCSGQDNASFIKGLITPEYVSLMPKYDAVINLSVFHHWVKAYGADAACEMMKVLASKCNHLVFETGQPNEIGTKWAEKLSFMGDAPEKWIENFLTEIGFTNVKAIGQYATGLTDVKRTMFFASK